MLLQRAGLRSLLANSTASLLGNIGLPKLDAASPGQTDAVSVSLNSNLMTGKLEKHLDDVSKNKGYLSKGVARQINQMSLRSSDVLAKGNPKAFSTYLGYMSGLGYEDNSRFVKGVYDASDTVETLRKTDPRDSIEEAIEKGILPKNIEEALTKYIEAQNEQTALTS